MIQTINPYSGIPLSRFEELKSGQLNQKIEVAHDAYLSWKRSSFKERSRMLRELAGLLRTHARHYGTTISLEMGKPITQAEAELKKCAWACDYYAQHGAEFLKDQVIATDAAESFVRYDPLGVLLAVMPWNFPYWQVIRFAAPALMGGNTILLKHASNVMQSAFHIEELFHEAGFPPGVFQNLCIGSQQVEQVIAHPLVKGVTLTGSEKAGKAVASTAGAYLKPSVMELGGSNPVIVMGDARVRESVETVIQARFQNTGQSCIAGKRLLLDRRIAAEFMDYLLEEVQNLKCGNPLDPETYIGVMARNDLAVTLEQQMLDSVKKGARIRIGGNRKNAWFEPTVLDHVEPHMEVFSQETFGPLLAVTIFDEWKEALYLADHSSFGLGVSVCTTKVDKYKEDISCFDQGAVFFNSLVKSDPRLPFGGIKNSGYGRELSKQGITTFMNAKTVFIS